ncbi:hypothetical protein B0H14DRAFT_2424741, partial [Mycena olivaceomarginata]
HADSEGEEQKPAASEQASANEEAPEEAPKEAEAEEEHPKIRADCEASPACAPMKHHFEKCQEKVDAGYKGEDCVDEMCHDALIQACAAPKLFSKLR